MDGVDLADLLRSWPYDPNDRARVIKCPDGREVLQVRQPLGMEQHEIDGRPDGERPHEMESALDYHLGRLEEAKARGEESRFALSHEDCVELINEGTLYYFRYVHLFQINDWERTARDTARNLRLFDLILQYSSDSCDADCLEQWRPYVVRMDAVARAMIRIAEENHAEALGIVEDAIARIEGLPDLEGDSTFQAERDRSLEVLRTLAKDIEQSRPLGEADLLQGELEQAVAAEDYERAAELRDSIRALRRGENGAPS